MTIKPQQGKAQGAFNKATPHLSVVADNTPADIIAGEINAANNLVVVIAEKQSKHYGQQAEIFHDAFHNCAFVFETHQAEENFYKANSSMAYYIHHQTIGILSQSEKNDETRVFDDADHIVVMGDMYGFNEDEFKAMQKCGKEVTFSNNPETPVDLKIISETRSSPRDFRRFAIRYRIGMVKLGG